MMMKAAGIAALLAAGLALVAGCGTGDRQGTTADDKLSVVTGFYPLQFVTQQVGGDHVDVVNLTKVGAEPHDLELAPRDVGTVADAGLVVYLKGFQPALDKAVDENAADHAFDVTEAAHLEPAHAEPEEAGHEGHHHADTGTDPHFWLDPTRLASVADAVADKLSADDPAHADDYAANAAALTQRLTELDATFAGTLVDCRSTELVTSHAAFGYLAARYGFTQESVSGLDPEQEPSPAELATLTRFVREHKVRTIYAETLVSRAIADTLAAETGAEVAVLDPLEGLTSTDADADYFSVMTANLATLKSGQGCP